MRNSDAFSEQISKADAEGSMRRKCEAAVAYSIRDSVRLKLIVHAILNRTSARTRQFDVCELEFADFKHRVG